VPDLEILIFDELLDARWRIGRIELIDAVLDQQVVLKRNEELRAARIALPSGAASQLVVDAAALVPVEAQHVQASQFRHPCPEPNVHPAAGHIRRDRHRAWLTRPDVGLRHFGTYRVALDSIPGEAAAPLVGAGISPARSTRFCPGAP
jgi:hypothetical protein